MATIGEQFQTKYKVDPNNFLCVSVATSGLDIQSVPLELAVAHDDFIQSSYILGGDPRGNKEYTNIGYEAYVANARAKGEVLQDFQKVLDKNKPVFLVFGAGGWTKRMLRTAWPELALAIVKYPILSMIDLVKARTVDPITLLEGESIGGSFDYVMKVAKVAPSYVRVRLDAYAERAGYDEDLAIQRGIRKSNCTTAIMQVARMAAILKDHFHRQYEEELDSDDA